MTGSVSATVRSYDGIPIAYDSVGSGDPALVLVHGWSCDRSYWRHQANAFANRHRVVTIDLAGHGESGDGRASWTMPSFGEDVVAVVDDLGLASLVLVGHSMGGDVIVESALRLGDRVAGLVWVDTYDELTTPQTDEQVQAFVEPFREDFVATTRAFVSGMFPPDAAADLVLAIASDMSAAPPHIALDALYHAMSNDGPVMRALPQLAVPIVAINPDYEPTDVESLRAYGVETVIASGVGHYPMLEDADQFNRLLAGVLDTFASDREAR